MPLTLRWNRLMSPRRVAQISWSRKAVGEEFPLHDHDFPEIFWVSEGTTRHTVNGVTTELGRGQLVFIRPDDCHGFRGAGEHGGTVCNLALRRDVLAHVRRRYFAGRRDAWWHDAAMPTGVLLTGAELRALDHAARELASVRTLTVADVDRFLLNLFHLLRERESPARQATEPAWLAAARQALADPQRLARGVPELVRLAGCSPEHLARTVRRVHGFTPTDLVNQQRLDWAAVELQFSSRGISDISLAAGFESLSHFYHLFRRQHGVTPRQFRLRARAFA